LAKTETETLTETEISAEIDTETEIVRSLMENLILEFSASHVLDEVSSACDVRITTLKMINISRRPFEMLAVASFVNLKNLYISPHNIGPDLVMCFGEFT
jgi:hypothetical protein